MALKNFSEIRNVNGITDDQKQRILDFLQGAVYCWCKNRPDEWFSMRNLMGADNFDWTGTPLLDLHLKHSNKGKNYDTSVTAAGKDSGWLLKMLIHKDKRNFETRINSRIREYCWAK